MTSVARTGPFDPESTQTLLARARSGDGDALNRLMERYLPLLRRWAHGRLPAAARDINDTQDVVQDAVVRALRRLDGFEPRHEGALLGYLRQAVLTQIIDLVRRAKRRPLAVTLPDDLPQERTSPLEAAIDAENSARYEAALLQLADSDRETIILRMEFHYSYPDIAAALGKPSVDAARLAVRRALERLALQMQTTSRG